MQLPLQIVFHGMPRSDALEARVREAAAKLEHFHERITSCHVTLEPCGHHRQQGRLYSARIELRAPKGADLIASRQEHADVFVAVRDAFDALRRQLQDAVREGRGQVKAHSAPGAKLQE